MNKKTQYIEALCKELEQRKDYLEGQEIQTIYFGGGTPSQLSAEDFKKIFTSLSGIVSDQCLQLKRKIYNSSLRGGTTKQTKKHVNWFASGKALAMTDTNFLKLTTLISDYIEAKSKSPDLPLQSGALFLTRRSQRLRRTEAVGLCRMGDEITLEANPDDITPEYLKSLKDLPFNRISIGIQSFNNEELRFLNRRHNAQKAIEAVKMCQDYGFRNISVDLMYGLPNQTMEIWEETLSQALHLNIQHISAYHLIYEEGTKLYELLSQRKIVPADEDLSVEMFSNMIDMLEANGFVHYEISNFAKPGFESKHNSSYWNGTHYLGIGAAAHSFNGKARHRNIPDIDQYIQSINQGNLSSEIEVLNEKDAYNDFILTRMRTMKGMDLNELEALHGKEKRVYCLRQAQKYIQNQTILPEDNFLRLTRKGIFISDGIMSDLFL